MVGTPVMGCSAVSGMQGKVDMILGLMDQSGRKISPGFRGKLEAFLKQASSMQLTSAEAETGKTAVSVAGSHFAPNVDMPGGWEAVC